MSSHVDELAVLHTIMWWLQR